MSELRFEGVSKHFGGIRALDGVSGVVEEGEILGLVGPNGSGKSTLINVLSGHYPADGGDITFDGADLGELAPHKVIETGIARTYQIPRPFPTLTVRQNVSIPLMFGSNPVDPVEARSRAEEWLSFTGLERHADQQITSLNLHQLKYLELARALATEPRLIFLDEVLSGLNPTEITASIEMVRRIHARGITIVIVEHLVRVVTELATRIVVLDQGRVIAEGEAGTVMSDPGVITAYLGKRFGHA